MKTIDLKQELSKFLRLNGAESFTKLISDSIDEAGPIGAHSIHETRAKVATKLTALNKLNLLDR